jgi:hypothetical protein
MTKTIKEKLKDYLLQNREGLESGRPCSFTYTGSHGYLKQLAYDLGEELGLALRVSIKQPTVTLSLRQTTDLQPVLSMRSEELAPQDEDDLDPQDILGS